jgi:hypothetical protein
MIKSRRMRWSGNVARVGEKRNAYNMLVGKPVGRFIRRWEGNNKMGLREIEWGVMVWIDLTVDRDQWSALVNTLMNLRVP